MRKICEINVIFLVLLLINSVCDAKISNLRKCANPECSEPISLGITQVNYNAVEKYVLSFRANVHVKIFSKSAGNEPNYWGAEIQGRRGYIPMNLVRERKILTSNLPYEVPTELALEEAGQTIQEDTVDEAANNTTAALNETVIPIREEEKADEPPKVQEIAPEVKEVADNKIEEQKSIEEENKSSEGFFSNLFGGDSEEKTEESPQKVVEEPDKTPEDTESQATPEEVVESEEQDDDDGEDDYEDDGEEDEEEDESTEPADSLENPIDLEELPPPDDNEIFKKIKILSTAEELPQQPPPEQVSSESKQETVPEVIPDNLSQEKAPEPSILEAEKKSEEEVVLNSTETSQEVVQEITTPTSEEVPHYYTDEFVTPPTLFEEQSEETEKVPDFKPIPPLVNSSETEGSEEKKEIPPEIKNEEKVEQTSIPPAQEAVKDERIEIPVVESVEEAEKPVTPQNPIPVPPLPGFNIPHPQAQEIPASAAPEVTPFPPIHEHPPPFLNVPAFTEAPSVVTEAPIPPAIPAEDIPVEKEVTFPDISANDSKEEEQQQSATEPPLGVGSIEPIVKDPPKEEEKEQQQSIQEDVSVEDSKEKKGFFSGLFNSIKETLNMKIGKDSGEDKTAGCIDEYCYRPQGQEHKNGMRHPMVSPHQHQQHSSQEKTKKEAFIPEESGEKSGGMTLDEFLTLLMESILGMSSLILYLCVSAGAILLFTFGHYLVVQCSRERQLVFRLNSVERKLMVAYKENGSLKGELVETREKLTSIEDNSFGSNDMVIALRRELDNSESLKISLQEQVASLEKELENAAEAGLELNRMVSELLSNQSGSDSIISSVEELQKQLNEQQNTILTINASLAEKSRENSELQVNLTEQEEKFTEEINSLRDQLSKIQEERLTLEENAKDLQLKLDSLSKEKSSESQDLKQQIQTHQNRYEDISKALTQSQSRVQVLEDCIKSLKQESGQKGGSGAGGNFEEIMNVANLKTQLVAATKEKQQMKEKLDEENEARKLLEDHVKIVREEVEKIRQEYNDAEKEKLEAQTRLEVLTSYFKDKETQLQKELSVKEAMWMKSQGETTSTVEKVRAMQDEIQTLKSQNDALRAEIEAQRAAHKAQIGALEARAQESWLTARQAERRLEESRIESSTLRRKLTSFAENGVNSSSNSNNIENLTDTVENPGSPLLGVLPPPPFLPPPFMPPPPPFMPPGPFIPAEMRLPPLGRLMSPPPPNNRYSPNLVDDRDGRFSPGDRARYTPDRFHDRYSPPHHHHHHRMSSPYETETDVSPPPTPPLHPRGGGGGGYRGYSAYSPPPPPHHQQQQQSHDERAKQFKGGLSSGSADSLGPRKSGGNAKV